MRIRAGSCGMAGWMRGRSTRAATRVRAHTSARTKASPFPTARARAAARVWLPPNVALAANVVPVLRHMACARRSLSAVVCAARFRIAARGAPAINLHTAFMAIAHSSSTTARGHEVIRSEASQSSLEVHVPTPNAQHGRFSSHTYVVRVHCIFAILQGTRYRSSVLTVTRTSRDDVRTLPMTLPYL
jgi:hypothetical protein